MLPPSVDTNKEFEEYENQSGFDRVEKYGLLMRSIQLNHKIKDGLCLACCQDLTYLVYTHQVECFKITQTA